MSTPLRFLVLAYAACALIWGTTWYAIRVCVGPGGYPLLEALVLRFGIAAVILGAFATRVSPWPRGRATWAWLGLAGVLNAVGYSLVYEGEAHISGGLAAVLSGVQPLLMAALLTITGQDRVARGELVGAGLSLLGVAGIFLDRIDVSWDQGLGVALVLGSVVCVTIYLSIMKRHARDAHPLAATVVFVGTTALALLVALVVRGPATLLWPPPLGPTLALAYLTLFGSVIAFATYFWLLSRVSLMTTGTLAFVFPLVALVVDAAFEDAVHLAPRTYLGVGLTLAGLGVSLRSRARL
ncbi:MAG: EamA family transporter [Kofleriaceae bacterium]